MDIAGDIDFVVFWVDGSDPSWRAEYEAYLPKSKGRDESQEKILGKRRYREWGLFRYFFRGIEAYAPWFRRLHLITSGQTPSWLNKNHSRLNLLTHRDIFENVSDLPVFNSSAIVANIDGIKGLAGQFIQFDDDFFVLKETPPSYFFEKGLPRDHIVYSKLDNRASDDVFTTFLCRTIIKTHNHFKLDPLKVFKLPLLSARYGLLLNAHNLINYILSFLTPKPAFFSPLGIYHYPQPLLRRCVLSAKKALKEDFIETSRHRFRQPDDLLVSYVYRYWHLLGREFAPFRSPGRERLYIRMTAYDSIAAGISKIFAPDVRFLCINDNMPDSLSAEEEGLIKNLIIRNMERRFPQKSTFEVS